MIRLVIYDDNEQRRKSLEALMLLSEEIECVASFEDCSNVAFEMELYAPDIVLMDIEMPNVNGIEGVAIIKKAYPSIHIIMQTVFEDDEKIFAALQAGAEGYILKNAGADKIIQSIHEVHEGGAYMTPSVALRVIKHFNQNPIHINYNLTHKEQEALILLADGNSYKMVADKMSVSYFTVNAHIKKIYQKLQVHSVTAAVAMAFKNNLV
ncbi:MAG: response regulator transcription factor [Chitinophagaceae bacterium]